MKASVFRLAAAAWLAGLSVEVAASSSEPKWKGATTYPTTVMRIWSRTLTAKPTKEAAAAAADATATTAEAATETVDAATTLQTVTMYEAWPSSPDPQSFPYTLLQTAITSRQLYTTHVDAEGGIATEALSMEPTAATRTVTSTWLLWSTSPTDLAAGEKMPACDKDDGHGGKCVAPNMKQDKRCTDHGLTTACHSQCKIRPVEGWYVWWCHKRGDGTSKGSGNDTRAVALGRVCTDSMTYYEQLLEPCDTMDHGHDCPPCSG